MFDLSFFLGCCVGAAAFVAYKILKAAPEGTLRARVFKALGGGGSGPIKPN